MSKTRQESGQESRPREELLRDLRLARSHAKKKALRGKIFNESKERIRQTWLKLWISSLTAEASILKDVEVDELAREVEQLQEAAMNTPEVNYRLERLRRIEREKFKHNGCSGCQDETGEVEA